MSKTRIKVKISDSKKKEDVLPTQPCYEDVGKQRQNEIEMRPNVVYRAGDQKPSGIKMKKNQLYSMRSLNETTLSEQETRLYDVADGEEPRVLSLDKGDDGEKNRKTKKIHQAGICIV